MGVTPGSERWEKNRKSNILKEGDSKEIHAKEVDTDILSQTYARIVIKWMEICLPQQSNQWIRGLSGEGKKEVWIFFTNPSTAYSYAKRTKLVSGIFITPLLGALNTMKVFVWEWLAISLSSSSSFYLQVFQNFMTT